MPGRLQQPLHILELDFGIREQIMVYPNMKNSVFGLAEVEVDGGQVRRSLFSLQSTRRVEPISYLFATRVRHCGKACL